MYYQNIGTNYKNPGNSVSDRYNSPPFGNGGTISFVVRVIYNKRLSVNVHSIYVHSILY